MSESVECGDLKEAMEELKKDMEKTRRDMTSTLKKLRFEIGESTSLIKDIEIILFPND